MRKRHGNKRITLNQVAQKAGVSESAASFALTGRDDQRLSKDTVKKIKAAALELGYRPNLTAKTLRTGQSGTIAMISDFVSSTSLSNGMIAGVLSVLKDEGKLLFTVDSQGDQNVQSRLIDALLDRQVDGILYTSMFTRMITFPEALHAIPTVLLNSLTENPEDAFSVVPNEYLGGQTAASILINAGHRNKVCFVGSFPDGVTGGPQWKGLQPWALEQRMLGITDTFEKAHLSLLSIPPIKEWTCEAGREVGCHFLDSGKELPSAFICVNDALAFGMMQVLQVRGIHIPEEVSFIAFDGSSWSDASWPPLTSIILPHEELGRFATRALLAPQRKAGVHMITMPVKQGESVAAPRE